MSITRTLPDVLARSSPEELTERIRTLLVLDDVRTDHLTRAGGARALGMPLATFLVLAGTHGIYAIDYDPDDFRRELADIDARGF